MKTIVRGSILCCENNGENTGENTGEDTGENIGDSIGENTGENTGDSIGENTGEESIVFKLCLATVDETLQFNYTCNRCSRLDKDRST